MITVISWLSLDANSQGDVIPLLKTHWHHARAKGPKYPDNILKYGEDPRMPASSIQHIFTGTRLVAGKETVWATSPLAMGFRENQVLQISILGSEHTDWRGQAAHGTTAPWFWNLRRISSSLSFKSAVMTQKDKKRDTGAGTNHLIY